MRWTTTTKSFVLLVHDALVKHGCLARLAIVYTMPVHLSLFIKRGLLICNNEPGHGLLRVLDLAGADTHVVLDDPDDGRGAGNGGVEEGAFLDFDRERVLGGVVELVEGGGEGV